MATTADELREEVRRRYAESARAVADGAPAADAGAARAATTRRERSRQRKVRRGALRRRAARASCPRPPTLASLGCGNPTAVADLHEGETVLDLGSGGGIDVILSAKRVGPTGTAYGLDMTDEMLALAQQNAAEAGVHERALPEGHDRADPAARRARSTW